MGYDDALVESAAWEVLQMLVQDREQQAPDEEDEDEDDGPSWPISLLNYD